MLLSSRAAYASGVVLINTGEMVPRGGMIQTALGLIGPCGRLSDVLRATRLSNRDVSQPSLNPAHEKPRYARFLYTWCPGADKFVRNKFGQPKAGRSPSTWMCESIEPPTRGFSVDVPTDCLIRSIRCKLGIRVC